MKIYGICSEDGTGEDRVHFLQSGDTGKRSEVSDKKGYQVKKIQPVEMFAFTEHVETVVLYRDNKRLMKKAE